MVDFLSSNRIEGSLYFSAFISNVLKSLHNGLSTSFKMLRGFCMFL